MKHNLNIEDFDISEIESIELIGEGDTIDISVEDTHMIFANDIYTHNSGMGEEKVKSNTVGESIGIIAIADVVIGVGRTDEQKAANEALIGVLKNRNGKDGFYRPAIFDTGKVFIKIKDVDPQSIVVPGKNKKQDWKQNGKQKQQDEEMPLDEIYDIVNKNKEKKI